MQVAPNLDQEAEPHDRPRLLPHFIVDPRGRLLARVPILPTAKGRPTRSCSLRSSLYGNHGPSRDELSEEAKAMLGRVYGFILIGIYEKERRKAIERNVDPEE